MKEIVYQENIYPGTRAELVARLREVLSDHRFQHVLGVEQAAIKLAEQNGCSVEKASVAALLHDYTKERSAEDFIAAIKAYHLDPDLLRWGNFIWHGVVGAEMVKTELHVTDEEILNAIRRHTVGAVTMTTLDKIVYVADYIEAGRSFPGVEQARKLAATDLDQAVSFETKHTIQFLMEQNKPVYPQAILTYNRWVAGKK
ncbi:bis(5'-nucleosyl)-tetraphosphatase (symmetrical) YqeK [Ligilactobacillus saerimneri]|uniref:bis(5'-nucleosyl)-tetraphosphatase (symmetrical) YqeK n=1 Tax=Ligilactobacillus saerimneri TaxID=228229 RepID=UPI000423EAA2|nr:bis(5'-nucleosyl)-tetraphosphatase (symmetrical) YqeK [Ligilactobacillus saerimneri]KRL74902.1 hypothetical protein FC54_GL000051 [Ligilactobacillus saerimneri DSM 16049]MBU5308929.1 bis(5'-nucleosyl)-tetraphosphatase (symmetrical) YqeK [Ligilactobacillus saerimneri]MCZ0891559.1 bis(5'-nucleosyl)-tetraphosphatase (symmetrical) YqeK [Ligilactobacillus saerimneri]HJF29721.1 bis(5'-nucleosyl)-tetraphosphatase (symmetrical) YqeK [Ligilactobacillus saerimneri]